MINIAVCGANGKMGQQVIKAVSNTDDMAIVARIDINNGEFATIRDAKDSVNIDILVDFTQPSSIYENALYCLTNGINIVIGTTGLSDGQISELKKLSEANKLGCLIAPNFSTGAVLMMKFAQMASKYFNNAEIIEFHHNQKKDAPSGTAMTAFEVIAESLNRDPEEVGVYGRQGLVGKRTPEEIGIHAIRGGDIVGDHTVMFVGDGERIEVKHQAHTREVFIAGVIRAIRYVPTAETGVISSMNDVLGLE